MWCERVGNGRLGEWAGEHVLERGVCVGCEWVVGGASGRVASRDGGTVNGHHQWASGPVSSCSPGGANQ